MGTVKMIIIYKISQAYGKRVGWSMGIQAVCLLKLGLEAGGALPEKEEAP